MRSISIAVATITAPVIEVVDVVVIERIAYAVVVEIVVGLIPIMEIVVVEISILPIGHVTKSTVSGEV